MNLSRISGAIDVNKTAKSCVAVVGAGGSAGLISNLARSGVAHFKLFDFDRVSHANVARQQHDEVEAGQLKVDALARAIHRINPATTIECIADNILTMPDDELRRHISQSDLLILATDVFNAQARGNELALETGVPAMWIGIYEAAGAGEIVFWHLGIDACFRCLCAKRYALQAAAQREQKSADPPSDGCTIFDVSLVDAIAGMIALGLLTRGSDNRFGRLIDELGDRNFIQVQLVSGWTLGGVNPVRKYLDVADDCPAYFSWNTIVRRDPDNGNLYCPDCSAFRGHEFRRRPDYTSYRVRATAFRNGVARS